MLWSLLHVWNLRVGHWRIVTSNTNIICALYGWNQIIGISVSGTWWVWQIRGDPLSSALKGHRCSPTKGGAGRHVELLIYSFPSRIPPINTWPLGNNWRRSPIGTLILYIYEYSNTDRKIYMVFNISSPNPFRCW